MASTLVIGFGNTLRGDDAVGILAVRALRDTAAFGPEVAFLEMEAAMVNLLDHLDGVEHLLVADSLQSGDCPGRLRRMGLEELAAATGGAVSTHQLGLSRVLQLAGDLGFIRQQKVTICTFEIEPPADFSDQPSALAQRCLPAFIDLIATTIKEAAAGGSVYGHA